MKLNPEELEEMIEPVEKTDLIYGIDDRPPFKEALFAAFATFAGDLCGDHYTSVDYCRSLEAGVSKRPVSWFRWHFLHPVSRHSYSVAELAR